MPATLAYQRRPQIGNVSIDTSGEGVSILVHAQPMSGRRAIDILTIQLIVLGFALFAASALGVVASPVTIVIIALAWFAWAGISWRRRIASARAATFSMTATAEGFEQTFPHRLAEPLNVPRATINEEVARLSPPAFKVEPVTLLLRLTTGQEIEIGRGSLAEVEAIEAALRKGLQLPKTKDSEYPPPGRRDM